MSEHRYSSKKARFRSVKDRYVTKLEKKNAVYCDATEVACNIRHFSFIPRKATLLPLVTTSFKGLLSEHLRFSCRI